MLRISTKFNASLISLNENIAFEGLYNQQNIILKSELSVSGSSFVITDLSAIVFCLDTTSTLRVPIKLDISNETTPIPPCPTGLGFLYLKVKYDSVSSNNFNLASALKYKTYSAVFNQDGTKVLNNNELLLAPIYFDGASLYNLNINYGTPNFGTYNKLVSSKNSIALGLSKTNKFAFLVNNKPILVNERYFNIVYTNVQKVINEGTPETSDTNYYTEIITTITAPTGIEEIDMGETGGITKILNVLYFSPSPVGEEKTLKLYNKAYKITNCLSATNIKTIFEKVSLPLDKGGVLLAGVISENLNSFNEIRDYLDLTGIEKHGENRVVNSLVLEVE